MHAPFHTENSKVSGKIREMGVLEKAVLKLIFEKW